MFKPHVCNVQFPEYFVNKYFGKMLSFICDSLLCETIAFFHEEQGAVTLLISKK